MVFRFKCYILPFFGRSDGNVDKYSVLIFFSCNLMYIISICAQLQTSSASPSLLINFFKEPTPPRVLIYHY